MLPIISIVRWIRASISTLYMKYRSKLGGSVCWTVNHSWVGGSVYWVANHCCKPLVGTLVPNQTKRILLVDEKWDHVIFTITLSNVGNRIKEVELNVYDEIDGKRHAAPVVKTILMPQSNHTSPSMTMHGKGEVYLCTEYDGIEYTVEFSYKRHSIY